MKVIIIAAIVSLLSACATQGDPCDDPNLHCNYVKPLPANAATHVETDKSGVKSLKP